MLSPLSLGMMTNVTGWAMNSSPSTWLPFGEFVIPRCVAFGQTSLRRRLLPGVVHQIALIRLAPDPKSQSSLARNPFGLTDPPTGPSKTESRLFAGGEYQKARPSRTFCDLVNVLRAVRGCRFAVDP